MSDNLTAAELAELQAAIEALTPTERCILEKLMEQHDIEDVFEIISAMAEADDDAATEYRFTDPDPYAKAEPLSDDRLRNFRFGEGGCIRVNNLSAFWLPELALKKEIGGTVYSVTGTYEGTETLDRKLERILENNLENMEDSE